MCSFVLACSQYMMFRRMDQRETSYVRYSTLSEPFLRVSAPSDPPSLTSIFFRPVPDPSPRHPDRRFPLPDRRFPLLFISSPLTTRHTSDRLRLVVCHPAWHKVVLKKVLSIWSLFIQQNLSLTHPDHLLWFWTQVRQPWCVCFCSRRLLRKVPTSSRSVNQPGSHLTELVRSSRC